MSYRCPLCLKELTAADQLVRFCPTHNKQRLDAPFNCEPSTLTRRVFCPRLGCTNNGQIEEGVFLLHLGCEAKNPFWDKANGRIDVPGDQDSIITSGEVLIGPEPETVNVRHWEIGMLRKVPNNYSDEMWFPLMLLRATAEEDLSGRRVGALVELAGAQKVGKTVVALQAMDDQGYVPEGCDNRSVRVKGFIFSRKQSELAAGDIPLLSNLYLQSIRERDGAGGVAPQGTPPRARGDLKASFLLPADSPLTARDNNHASTTERVKSSSSVFVRDLGRLVSRTLKPTAGASTKRPFWYTVIFYDAAGEDEYNERPRPEMVAVDKLAIFLDARVLFGERDEVILEDAWDGVDHKLGDEQRLIENSIETAVRRLSVNSTGRRIPCCLVITKLDLVLGKLNENEKAAVERIINDLGGETPDAARQLLVGWLKRNKVGGNRQKLLNLLVEDERRASRKGFKNVEKVFFIWTKNLSETKRADRIQPESYGLIQFICWCLSNRWSDFNQLGDGAN